MPVPSTEDIRRALLEILRVGNPRSITAKGWITLAAEHLGVTALIQTQDGKELRDRVKESLRYLTEQHMISNPSRYTYMIMKKGQSVLEDKAVAADEGFGVLPDDLDLTGDDAEAVVDDDDVVAEHDAVVAENDTVADHDAVVADESAVADHDTVVAGDDAVVAGDDAVVADESAVVADESAVVADESAVVADESAVVADESAVVADESAVVADESAVVADESAVADHDTVVAGDDAVAENDAVIAGDDAVDDDDAVVVDHDAVVADHDAVVADHDAVVADDDAVVADESAVVADESAVAADESAVVADESAVAADESAVAENDAVVADDDAVADHDAVIAENDAVVAGDDAVDDDAVADHDAVVVDHDAVVADENAVVADDDTVVADHDAVVTDNDTLAENNDAQLAESHSPESPDLQDSQQNIDIYTYTHTPNSIDEVDPDMPKDDLPADDFSTTEDFSSAVNQALNIDDVFERHNTELADKVLMRAAGLTPEMFAVFVTDLLSKMGYNAFQTARYTSDSEGNSMIQGVILDPKAKSPIYIHADKLSPGRTVGRSDMHDFADELAEKGGTGIFATTGEFSEQAGIYAQDERIMLIDGKKLAGLMIANNFCVNVAKVFEVKELDDDSFSEYE